MSTPWKLTCRKTAWTFVLQSTPLLSWCTSPHFLSPSQEPCTDGRPLLYWIPLEIRRRASWMQEGLGTRAQSYSYRHSSSFHYVCACVYFGSGVLLPLLYPDGPWMLTPNIPGFNALHAWVRIPAGCLIEFMSMFIPSLSCVRDSNIFMIGFTCTKILLQQLRFVKRSKLCCTVEHSFINFHCVSEFSVWRTKRKS